MLDILVAWKTGVLPPRRAEYMIELVLSADEGLGEDLKTFLEYSHGVGARA